MERTILHCDLNGFFASVELLAFPDLRDRPVAVCGDPKSRHGIVLAKNEPAKAFGVKTAETIWSARKKCPDLTILPAHHGLYTHYSKLVNEIYIRHSDLVEPFGIDESWLDVTGTMHLFGGNGQAVADRLRTLVRDELGLTISVGVSFNKIFAKLGSDMKKPDATTVITREQVGQLVWPLPVTDLLFVGRSSAAVLARFGIKTIGQLAAFDRASLVALLGKQGAALHEYANGEEHSPVAPAGTYTPPKSVGNGTTFAHNLTTWHEVRVGASTLTDSVAFRLRKAGMRATTLSVTLRDPQFRDISRQMTLPHSVCTARELAAAAITLLEKHWIPGMPIRALTVTALGLIPEADAGDQTDLFDPNDFQRRARQEQLEKTVDTIRNRFGKHVVSYTICHKPPAP